jgi:uncharacterized protein
MHDRSLSSHLYECRVMHARFAPRSHRFLYRIFLFAIDLDELEKLPRKVALFSLNRTNIYRFDDRDYLPTHEGVHNAGIDTRANSPVAANPLKARVLSFLSARGLDLTGGRIVLVTLPRVFGYGFNPVSFYFCYDRAGAPAAAIAEVTNTFREIKPYYLGPETQAAARGEFRVRVPKHFYVSPFSDVDVAFDFVLRTPGDRLSVQIDDYVGNERVLTSTLSGVQRPLTNGRLAWLTVKYPFLTLRIIGLIHWHALLLWWKRFPFFAKAARAADQRQLYRPHSSIASIQSSDAA